MSNDPSQANQENQDDFWDLGDDDLNLDEAAEEVQAEMPASPESAAAPEIASTEPVPEKTKPVLERKKDGWTEKKKEKIPLSMIEKISLVAVVICLLGAAGWVLSTFLKDAPQGSLIAFKEDYPAEGKKVTVEEVETWWRAPIRTGDDADVGVVIESNLIPCARIKVSEGNSTSLRVTFRDSDQELVGDTINLQVENGKFARSGSEEITIHSTAGFENPSRINAYANEDINPWFLTIIEEDSDDEDPLVKARISTVSKYK